MSNRVGKQNLTQIFRDIDPSTVEDVEILNNAFNKQRLVIHTNEKQAPPVGTRPKQKTNWNTRVMP